MDATVFALIPSLSMLTLVACSEPVPVPAEAQTARETAPASPPPPASAGTGAQAQAPEPVAPPQPSPPSFEQSIAHLLAGQSPSAESNAAAWKHYKAKDYAQAQREFGLASLHDRESWKPPFNLACSSALGGDEDATRVALVEAFARDRFAARRKALDEPDLASYAQRPWFTALVESVPGPAPGTDDKDGMYFQINGGGVVRLSPSGEFSRLSDSGSLLLITSDRQRWVSSHDYGLASLDDGEQLTTPKELGWLTGFAILGEGKRVAVGYQGVGTYDGSEWSIELAKDFEGLEPEAAFYDFVQDDSGRGWLMTTKHLYLRGPAAGERVLLDVTGFASDRFGHTVDRTPLVIFRGGVASLGPRGWTKLELPFPTEWQAAPVIALGPNGTAASWDRDHHRLMLCAADGVARELALPPTGGVYALSSDYAGRFWLSSSKGLFVVAEDLSSVERHYPAGSIDALDVRPGVDIVPIDIIALGPPVSLPSER